ncbi:MAG: TraB/GumN family protein [Povalibacter sp.]
MSRLLAVIALLVSIAAHAQDETSNTGSEPEQVLVVGEQPGPRLWKITHDDHVLWIMGALGPLPKRMTWRSHEVERVLASSQQLLTGVNVETDVGFFTKISLLPSLMSVRKNPDKKQLREVVPPDTYERWLRMKQRYLPNDNDVESWRPIFAAQKLYEAAVEKSGLVRRVQWFENISKLAKQRGVAITTPTLEIEIEKPRAALKEFKRSPLDDVDCFQRTLERVENDVETMQLRANAWAVGDIDALRKLPYGDVFNACANAVLGTESAQKQGLQNIPIRLRDTWVNAAESALRKNASTLAIVPMDEVLKPDGWVATLLARGYSLDREPERNEE